MIARPICKRVFTCFLLLTIIAPLSSAGPLHWLKQHPKTSKLIAATIAAGVAAAGLHHCRAVNGPEPCASHYGAAWQTYTWMTGANFAMVAVSEGCRKNDGGKFCNLLGYGGSTIQLGFGISQWRKD